MKLTRQILSDLPTSELDRISQMIDEIKEDRATRYQEKLWSDVVAAIETYEREIGQIQVLLPLISENDATIYDLTHPGGIAARYE